MVDKITKTSTKTIGGHRTCPRTWKKTNNIRFAVGFLAFGLLWSTGLYMVATVLRIQKVK